MRALSQTFSSMISIVFNTYRTQRLSILIYHRVLDDFDYMRPGEPTVAEFDQQMEVVARYFNVLSLREALDRLRDNSLPERAVCITFDDGYADNARLALPVLKKWQLPATVFVASSFLDGGIMWNDVVIESIRSHNARVIDLSQFDLGCHDVGTPVQKSHVTANLLSAVKHSDPEIRQAFVDYLKLKMGNNVPDLMLSTGELRLLHDQGVEIGGHTRTHPILATLSDEKASAEIIGGKSDLEAILDESIIFFAYPNGRYPSDYTDAHAAMVSKAGYTAALSTHWGVNNRETDTLHLARFTPWDRNRVKFLLRLHHNCRHVVTSPG